MRSMAIDFRPVGTSTFQQTEHIRRLTEGAFARAIGGEVQDGPGIDVIADGVRFECKGDIAAAQTGNCFLELGSSSVTRGWVPGGAQKARDDDAHLFVYILPLDWDGRAATRAEVLFHLPDVALELTHTPGLRVASAENTNRDEFWVTVGRLISTAQFRDRACYVCRLDLHSGVFLDTAGAQLDPASVLHFVATAAGLQQDEVANG